MPRVPVWHPEVHSDFGETLRFLAIEAKEYHKALDYIHKSFHDVASIYEVYGNKDFMVRVYANDRNYQRIHDTLQEKVGRVTSVFTVGAFVYLWGFRVPEDFNKSTLNGFDLPELKKAAEGWHDLDRQEKERCEKMGLVIGERSEDVVPDSVRVFIFVGSERINLENIREMMNEIEELPTIKDYLHGLYRGTNTEPAGSVLLELDVPKREFNSIIRAIREIHRQFKFITPRTTTFIAADITRERVDRCAFEESIQKAADRWENRFPAMGSLPAMEKLWLAGNCQRWSKWFNLPQTSGFATEVVDAIIEMKRTGKREKIKNAVINLSGPMEELLRRTLQKSGEEQWGKEGWQERMKEDLNFQKPFREWTLGQLVEAFRRLSDRAEEISSTVELSDVQRFLDLRNAAGHVTVKKGKKNLDEYSEDELLLDFSHSFELLVSLRTTDRPDKEIRTGSESKDLRT